MLDTLESLFKLARNRKNNPVEGSYTNKLLSDKSLSKKKVLEEINELIESVEKNTNKIHEAADVFYHLIMYLEANDINGNASVPVITEVLQTNYSLGDLNQDNNINILDVVQLINIILSN